MAAGAHHQLLMAVIFLLLALPSSQATTSNNLGDVIVTQSRRLLNFGSLFGSATKALPYDRVGGHPVFCVTTPWGSPYLNMEKMTDPDEAVQPDAGAAAGAADEYRSVALFFMDPDDALAVHGEMSQMESMEQADIRITSMSLSKALRQSSHLGNGMLTGFAPDPLTGRIKPVQEGGSLRYKIVPPKRQLYYAARCKGKERVGLFADSPAEDANAAVIGNSALEALNLQRRRDNRGERKVAKKMTAMGAANKHMDGYSGIPVFYAPDMQRSVPRLKQLMCGVARETPLFFNYEDLEDAWSVMRKRNARKKNIPEKPTDVEVFNLWDVVTSMEREMYNQETSFTKKAVNSIRDRFVVPKEAPGLESITFVPSSRSITYKESITARGNGKARLRPMR